MFDIHHFDGIIYGADYNPEQWPRETWPEDARLMNEAGVNLVSLGIFSWAHLEARPGHYNFDWLDEVMDLLHQHGIGVNLATATASPPPWLSLKYPDSKPVTADGIRLEVGGRQLYCPSHPAFRSHVRQLTEQIAQRYQGHPALKMWHVNNEYGCHVDQCFCDLCAEEFRTWLRGKYGTLDALNFAWGTAFWSQRYGDWAEIQPPRRAPTYANPTQQLDWRRFSSDNLLTLYRLEAGVLQQITPHLPVTTNFLGFLPGLDYFKWAQEEDVVSLDAYPDPSGSRPHMEAGMSYDLMRSLRGGQRWILMEQAPSAVNWRERNTLKRPGLMRLLNHQALAHGASGLMFFQWRASRAGAEKYHSGMVQHVGPDRSRVWQEVKALGQELKSLRELTEARLPARVAVMFDWNNWWALEIDSKPAALKLMPLVQKWYAALRQLGQNVDFVHPEGDLSGYDVVALPNQYLLAAAGAQNIRSFVERGGTLVSGFFSGIVDEHEHIQLGGYPALLSDVLGLWIEEWLVMQPHEEQQMQLLSSGKTYGVQNWAEVIHVTGAEILATFQQDFIAGQPAVTLHPFGAGQSYYLGGDFTEEAVTDLLEQALTQADVPVCRVPESLNVTLSALGDDRVLHLLNVHPTQSLQVGLPEGGTRFENGAPLPQAITLPPYGVLLARYSRAVRINELNIVAEASARLAGR
ncbi:MAG: beta-galactosidase [Deinococcus sp.]|nr:beta-galactosidase [Deinococcus sp.]